VRVVSRHNSMSWSTNPATSRATSSQNCVLAYSAVEGWLTLL
jgi:hypothetical protein